MVQKYFNGTIPNEHEYEPIDDELINMVKDLREKFETQMENFQFSSALSEIWKVIARANKYIDETMPWVLGKNPDKKNRLAQVLYNLCESLRIISSLLTPFMPNTAPKIQEQIGADKEISNWESAGRWGLLPQDAYINKGNTLFPRIDTEKEIEELNSIIGSNIDKKNDNENTECVLKIGIEDFMNVKLIAASVIACEPIKKSKKLLKLTLNDGEGERTVVSGISQYYKPEDLIGRNVVLVSNLKPAKLCGTESNGMILAAECGKNDVKVIFVDDVPAGSTIR